MTAIIIITISVAIAMPIIIAFSFLLPSLFMLNSAFSSASFASSSCDFLFTFIVYVLVVIPVFGCYKNGNYVFSYL